MKSKVVHLMDSKSDFSLQFNYLPFCIISFKKYLFFTDSGWVLLKHEGLEPWYSWLVELLLVLSFVFKVVFRIDKYVYTAFDPGVNVTLDSMLIVK